MVVKGLRQPREGEAVASAGSEQVAGQASAEATTWVRVASLADLPPGSALEVRHGHRVYVLFRLGDSVSCLDGLCPHQGQAMDMHCDAIDSRGGQSVPRISRGANGAALHAGTG